LIVGENQELSFRASLRIAAFLASEPAESEKIFREIKASYDARSKIVHGNQPKGDITAICDSTKKYLQQLLIRVISKDEKWDPSQIEIELLRSRK